MKISIFLLLGIFTALLFSSCKYDPSSVTITSVKDFFPLNVGDKWTYHLQNFGSDGTTIADTTSDIIILDQIDFQGTPEFIYSLGDTTEFSNRNIIYYGGNSDVFITKDGANSVSMLHYPMNEGQSLTLSDTTYSDGSQSMEVLVLRQSNESVSVPAGNFFCLHYDHLSISTSAGIADTTNKVMLYFSRGVGLVQERDYSEKNKGEYYMNLFQELVAYQLK